MHPNLIPFHATFHAHANPQEAKAMAVYMKNRFSFLGLKAPQRKILAKEFIAHAKGSDKVVPEVLIREMWDLPEREFQYTAIDAMIRYQQHAPHFLFGSL